MDDRIAELVNQLIEAFEKIRVEENFPQEAGLALMVFDKQTKKMFEVKIREKDELPEDFELPKNALTKPSLEA